MRGEVEVDLPPHHRVAVGQGVGAVERLVHRLPAGPDRRQGPAQRAARSTMTRLQNAEISEIFQNKGLHEFLTEFIAENARLGETIAKQYLT